MEDAYVLRFSERKFQDLYICFCGRGKCRPLHSYGPAVRPNYILHFITEGKGSYQIHDKKYHLKKGQGFLIPANVQIFYQADEKEPWNYMWVGFNGTNVQRYIEDMGLGKDHHVFLADNLPEIEKLFDEMLQHNTASLQNEYLLQGYLFQILSYMMKDAVQPSQTLENKAQGKMTEYVRKAVEFIQNNYTENIRITDIANYVSINRSYLSAQFSQCLGLSPHEYLTNFRVTRAAELLILTSHSIESIAYSCGYNDPFLFTKTFKKKKGVTPARYRKENRTI